MKNLIQTILTETNDGSLNKFEIYSKHRKLDIYEKVPEGSCRVVLYKLEANDHVFKIIDSNVDLQNLFEKHKPDPNTWYSDGPNRVNLEMVIAYLVSGH